MGRPPFKPSLLREPAPHRASRGTASIAAAGAGARRRLQTSAASGRITAAPYALADARALQALFADAGVPRAALRPIDCTVWYPSIRAWVETDVKGWTLAELFGDLEYRRLEQEAERRLRPFEGPDGLVAFSSPAHVVSPVRGSSPRGGGAGRRAATGRAPGTHPQSLPRSTQPVQSDGMMAPIAVAPTSARPREAHTGGTGGMWPGARKNRSPDRSNV